MQAKSSRNRNCSQRIRARKARALAMASSVSGGKAISVMRTCGKRCSVAAPLSASARRSRAPARRNAPTSTPLPISAMAWAARAPTAMISMPVASPRAARRQHGGAEAGERIQHRPFA